MVWCENLKLDCMVSEARPIAHVIPTAETYIL